MGAGSDYDMDGQHRQYSVKYSLSTADGVKRLLTDMHRLRSARFERGDYSASDILLDLDTAIRLSNLTIRQRQAVYYCYEEDLRQVDAAAVMEVTQEAVTQFIAGALKRISSVYERWNYGEIEVVYFNENNNEGDTDNDDYKQDAI